MPKTNTLTHKSKVIIIGSGPADIAQQFTQQEQI
jgi:hypothetical protein